MTTDKINLASKLALFQDHWKPRTVARLNEYDIMVVKVQGETSLLLIEPAGTPNTGDARTAAPRQEL